MQLFNSRIPKSKRMIYECGYLNCRILKSLFILVLKCVTYIFILSFFLASCFLFVSALVFLSSSASFIVFSYHCKFILIRSLSTSLVVYKKKLFNLFVCFLAKGSLTLHFLFCFCSRASSRFLLAFIVFFVPF